MLIAKNGFAAIFKEYKVNGTHNNEWEHYSIIYT